MYLISTGVVSWNGVNSDQFKLCNGVKQGGCNESSTFLCLYKSFNAESKQ